MSRTIAARLGADLAMPAGTVHGRLHGSPCQVVFERPSRDRGAADRPDLRDEHPESGSRIERRIRPASSMHGLTRSYCNSA
jgi:hypothetical protein